MAVFGGETEAVKGQVGVQGLTGGSWASPCLGPTESGAISPLRPEASGPHPARTLFPIRLIPHPHARVSSLEDEGAVLPVEEGKR